MSFFQRWGTRLALVLFCIVPPIAARASTTGEIRGTVTAHGKPVADAHVMLMGEGRRYARLTGTDGSFTIFRVPFGHYRLMAMRVGLAMQSREIDLHSGEVLRLRIALHRLATIIVTKVVANQSASGTPVASTTIDRAQIKTLPTNNSLNSIVQTVPGIVAFSYNEPVAHGFHGLTYEIDGVPLPQGTSSNFSELIDPKNVSSVEVLTGAMPAEYGGSRIGAVVNIVTKRLLDLPPGLHTRISGGIGNQGMGMASLDETARFGKTDVFFSSNSQRTDRGIDTPTYTPIHDQSSLADQFFRMVEHPNERTSLAFTFSNQLAQFQIPINTNPNNPNDPIVSVPGTDDVQREYDRFVNAAFSRYTKKGNGYLQIVPWFRSSRVVYAGDLSNDVLGTQPNPNGPGRISNIGLNQDRFVSYVGLRVANLVTSRHHAIKYGLDIQRASFQGSQTFAQLGLPNASTSQGQAGSETGLYIEDSWQPSKPLSFDYGVRWDTSHGYVSGSQISPRVGVNYAVDGKNILHAYYGRFYAAPQLEDTRADCVVLQGCSTTPTYNLKPEFDSYYEAGFRHIFNPRLTGSIDFWFRNVANVLDTTQLLNTPLFAVYNNTVGQAHGIDIHLAGHDLRNVNSWFLSSTISQSLAGGISGSTFLFPPNQPTYPLQLEDHSQTVSANGAFTHRFGRKLRNFATLQTVYGTGFPVQFQNGNGLLPTHLTFDFGIGQELPTGNGKHLTATLEIDNLLNHQYIIKMANGFNTTQIANGRTVMLKLSETL